jgi:hypothetical protein
MEDAGGRLYDTKQPAIFIRLTGQPLVGATRYEQEVLPYSYKCLLKVYGRLAIVA